VRNLTLGDRGREVSDVQKRLRAQGFVLGSEGVDGFYGPNTRVAVCAFQQRRDLLVDGEVGDNTWRELVETGYELGDRLLYLREPQFRGDDVLALQVKLNLLGFNAGPERGVHDEDVEKAVLDFQRNAGLMADGIVGPTTLRKLEALRKAESGREGKKIPDRHGGRVEARTLAGQVVAVDAGHGGADSGVVSPRGVAEKDVALALALRLEEVLRAEGCQVVLTRGGDHEVPLYERTETVLAADAHFMVSLHANGNQSPAAAGAACYYFQRGHFFSEHGRRLAEHVGARLHAPRTPFLGSFGRNYGILREPRAVNLLVEPLFLTNPADELQATRPEFVERVAKAIAAGMTDYLARAPVAGEAEVLAGPAVVGSATGGRDGPRRREDTT
jgi:N-acetylmuramoyl-L-alanine amidase